MADAEALPSREEAAGSKDMCTHTFPNRLFVELPVQGHLDVVRLTCPSCAAHVAPCDTCGFIMEVQGTSAEESGFERCICGNCGSLHVVGEGDRRALGLPPLAELGVHQVARVQIAVGGYHVYKAALQQELFALQEQLQRLRAVEGELLAGRASSALKILCPTAEGSIPRVTVVDRWVDLLHQRASAATGESSCPSGNDEDAGAELGEHSPAPKRQMRAGSAPSGGGGGGQRGGSPVERPRHSIEFLVKELCNLEAVAEDAGDNDDTESSPSCKERGMRTRSRAKAKVAGGGRGSSRTGTSDSPVGTTLQNAAEDEGAGGRRANDEEVDGRALRVEKGTRAGGDERDPGRADHRRAHRRGCAPAVGQDGSRQRGESGTGTGRKVSALLRRLQARIPSIEARVLWCSWMLAGLASNPSIEGDLGIEARALARRLAVDLAPRQAVLMVAAGAAAGAGHPMAFFSADADALQAVGDRLAWKAGGPGGCGRAAGAGADGEAVLERRRSVSGTHDPGPSPRDSRKRPREGGREGARLGGGELAAVVLAARRFHATAAASRWQAKDATSSLGVITRVDRDLKAARVDHEGVMVPHPAAAMLAGYARARSRVLCLDADKSLATHRTVLAEVNRALQRILAACFPRRRVAGQPPALEEEQYHLVLQAVRMLRSLYMSVSSTMLSHKACVTSGDSTPVAAQES